MTATLSPDEARAGLASEGSAIIDLRPAPAFCAGHPAGALCVPYSARGLARRIGDVDPGIRAVVLVGGDGGETEGASGQLDEVGIETLGRAPDEPRWWSDAGVGWQVLAERPLEALAGSEGMTVVDVREPVEWETGHAPGARLIPLGEVSAAADTGRIGRDEEIVLICEAGVRSATAGSILQKAGYRRVSHVPLGTAGIRQQGGALEYPSYAPPEAP